MPIRSRSDSGLLPALRSSASRRSWTCTLERSSGFSRSFCSISGQYFRTISITTGAAVVRSVIRFGVSAMFAS